jgi:hypothetical protein
MVITGLFTIVFMAAIPFCSLLNKAHLFSQIKHRSILIKLVAPICMLHVSPCTVELSEACQYNNLTKGDTVTI